MTDYTVEELRILMIPHAVAMVNSSDYFLNSRNTNTVAVLVQELINVITTGAAVLPQAAMPDLAQAVPSPKKKTRAPKGKELKYG